MNWENYRLMRNKVVKMRRKATQEHFRKLCEEKYGDQRKFWQTIKPYVNSRKNIDRSRIVLKDNDQIIRDQQQVCETLNEFFTSISRTVTTEARPLPDLSHITKNRPATQDLSLKETNPLEVKETLMKIKSHKATGSDLIPPLAVKQSAEVLCYPLCTLINHIFDNGKIPQQRKLGEVTPVYKKDCRLDKSNYRPITILPSLSKVFETIVHSRISPHFENIYHKYVFAYRKYHGCDTAILTLTEQWKKELDNHKIIGLVSMDLSKAFDTLPHNLIASKLAQYGADQKTLSLISDYLFNRRQRVKLGDRFSTWQEVTAGVPQGSILGPLLFNIFMNDLAYVIKNCNLATYADDTQIFLADNDPIKVQEIINSELVSIDKWYEVNGMKRNHSKYQAIIMGNTKMTPTFYCENTAIPIGDDLELFGVTIDNKLKFDKHIAKVSRKVSQQIAVLKRLRNMLPFEIRKNLYQSFIAPHFNYCSDTWHFCSIKSSTDKLEKVHERAIRFVFKDKNSSYMQLLKRLGIKSLYEQRITKIVSTVFKVLNHGDNIPGTLKELIKQRNVTYNLRGKDILTLPKIHTTKYGLKSWHYQAPKMWNTLPDTLRHSAGIREFKTELKKLDVSRLS